MVDITHDIQDIKIPRYGNTVIKARERLHCQVARGRTRPPSKARHSIRGSEEKARARTEPPPSPRAESARLAIGGGAAAGGIDESPARGSRSLLSWWPLLLRRAGAKQRRYARRPHVHADGAAGRKNTWPTPSATKRFEMYIIRYSRPYRPAKLTPPPHQ